MRISVKPIVVAIVGTFALSSCSSIYLAATQPDYSRVLKVGTERSSVLRRLGPPASEISFPRPTVSPVGFGSLTRRQLVVSKIDSWDINGYCRLHDEPEQSYGGVAGFVGEELTLGPLWVYDWSAAQRMARYRLHVAFDAQGHCMGHSRVLLDPKSLRTYPALEE